MSHYGAEFQKALQSRCTYSIGLTKKSKSPLKTMATLTNPQQPAKASLCLFGLISANRHHTTDPSSPSVLLVPMFIFYIVSNLNTSYCFLDKTKLQS